jgi:polyphosphate glucokinase
MEILGIDIGGSGIKGAVVDVSTGKLVTDRVRLETPQNGKAEDILETLRELVRQIGWHGPAGCGYPGVLQRNVIQTAANLPKDLVGLDLGKKLCEFGLDNVVVGNDADVAGFAEMCYGEGKHREGLVILLTLGTGLGSAVFVDGKLMPNTELGHLRFRGEDAESILVDRVRKEEGISWEIWGERFSAYLRYLEMLFSPTAFIIGGGTVKKWGKFEKYLECAAPIRQAEQGNLAGIAGAAAYAADHLALAKVR